jgi:hypothetical protein
MVDALQKATPKKFTARLRLLVLPNWVDDLEETEDSDLRRVSVITGCIIGSDLGRNRRLVLGGVQASPRAVATGHKLRLKLLLSFHRKLFEVYLQPRAVFCPFLFRIVLARVRR